MGLGRRLCCRVFCGLIGGGFRVLGCGCGWGFSMYLKGGADQPPEGGRESDNNLVVLEAFSLQW